MVFIKMVGKKCYSIFIELRERNYTTGVAEWFHAFGP
jgi:hypothetical protein